MRLQHMFLTQRSWEQECNLLMVKHDHGLEVDIGRNRNILLGMKKQLHTILTKVSNANAIFVI